MRKNKHWIPTRSDLIKITEIITEDLIILLIKLSEFCHPQETCTHKYNYMLYKYKYLVVDDACFLYVYSAIRLRWREIAATSWQCLVLNRLTKTGHDWEHLQERSRSPPPLSLWRHWYGWQQNPVERHSRFAVYLKCMRVHPSVFLIEGWHKKMLPLYAFGRGPSHSYSQGAFHRVTLVPWL